MSGYDDIVSGYADINEKLKAGGVILLPTETVYGLACDAENTQAVEKIYAIKGRDFQKPLAVCVKDLDMAKRLAVFSPKAIELAERYWPGSLTLIVEAKSDLAIDKKCQSRLGHKTTLALRCPEAGWLHGLNGPLALTSANRSGETDCVSYEAAMAELGADIDAAVTASHPLSGQPSTIISTLEGHMEILRQGALEVIL